MSRESCEHALVEGGESGTSDILPLHQFSLFHIIRKNKGYSSTVAPLRPTSDRPRELISVVCTVATPAIHLQCSIYGSWCQRLAALSHLDFLRTR